MNPKKRLTVRRPQSTKEIHSRIEKQKKECEYSVQSENTHNNTIEPINESLERFVSCNNESFSTQDIKDIMAPSMEIKMIHNPKVSY